MSVLLLVANPKAEERDKSKTITVNSFPKAKIKAMSNPIANNS